MAVHGDMYVGTDALANEPTDKLFQLVARFDPKRTAKALRVSPQDL
jgi:hypothetical protein